MSQKAFRWNKLTTKEKKALTSDKVFKNMTLKHGKRNCLFLKTSIQPLTGFKKINLEEYLVCRDILDLPPNDVSSLLSIYG